MKTNIIGDIRTAKQRLGKEKKGINPHAKAQAIANKLKGAMPKGVFGDSRMQGN